MEDWTISSEKYMANIVRMTAYSIGAILGDGCMRYVPGYGNGSWYVTEVATMDKEVVVRVANEINDVFRTEYKPFERTLRSGTKFYVVRANRKIIYDYFVALTGNRHSVPQEILDANRLVQLDFLAGIFDTDGSVKCTETWNGTRTKKNPRWQLGLSNTILEMVIGVAAVLENLGVQVGSVQTYKRGAYRAIYSIHPNIRSFIDAGCYFFSRRKQNRLDDYLKHVLGSETMHTAPITMGEDRVQQ